MSLDVGQVCSLLFQFRFRDLFTEELGWGSALSPKAVLFEAGGLNYLITAAMRRISDRNGKILFFATTSIDDYDLEDVKKQGSETSDVARTLQLTSPLVPSVDTTEEPIGDDPLAVKSRITKQAALSPTSPGLPELIAAPGYTPTFGPSATDLLSDQVSLSYQIFNVRMLLERSLTDRLIGDKPRLQAVLGLQVSIDPPAGSQGRAAYVEVTVSSATTPTDPVRLVSLMPFEKSYNSAALSTRSNAFGGSAVAKVLTLGYNQRTRQQNFFLFRDADTLALAGLEAPTSNATSFGWEFRPVLGRRSVTAGLRQLFAVVAVPAADEGLQPHELQVTVRTYWRKYNRRKLTTGLAIERPVDWGAGVKIDVPTSQASEKHLMPVIETVTLSMTDSSNGVATFVGKNFFAGTKVLLGSKTYDGPASGLTIKSDRTIELRADVGALGRGLP